MSSSSDILDVLNITKDEHAANKVTRKNQLSVKNNKKARQNGMNRELFNLIGSNIPPVMLTNKKSNKFKQRLNSNNKPTPWTWCEFKNNARGDNLKLYHWVKGSADLNKDKVYIFEKFNSHLVLPKIESESDYNEKNLQDDDWSYEETKYLFELCSDYDLRWIVIHDRYQFDDRSIEDLKERFYKVSEKLLSSSDIIPDEKTRNIINSLQSFDKQKEIERKEYLVKLLKRSPAEIAEEESLVIESRKFELAAKKMLTERASLLRILDSPQATASIQQYQTSHGLTQLYNALMISDKHKKRKVETPIPPQIPPAAATPSALIAEAQAQNKQQQQQQQLQQQQQQQQAQLQQAHGHHHHHKMSQSGSQQQQQQQLSQQASPQASQQQQKRKFSVSSLLPPEKQHKKNSNSQIANLLAKKLTPEEQMLYGISYHSEKLTPGVSLRSAKITSFRPAVQTRINSVLNELGIAPKPTIPTAKVCEKFEILLHTINLLLDAKRQTDKLETEIKIIASQRQKQ
ncbi:hypothetical protein PACTADRAFT_4086 [Pachysolen tannophilus NRRL Y-2460]|uniref:SWR1-complex protein 4 n=1 Tax=Pachysolen tannophilus NRRL Y-2460 TaxID=669874 RepID=A0A1E4TQY3_PACTA|nr:hypothetical protein PACTADRAFT_4086 [Pachysolen tannophilus NRRL Y-2460]